MKIGDYVRTKDGIIGKIEIKNYIGYSDWLIDTLYYNDDEIINGWTCGIKEYNIIRSSPNIIDLIEVGDYVNGYRVVWKDINAKEIEINAYYEDEKLIKNSNQIKSIVTKEQFESMKYEVK